jgi:hypothetical protein
MPITLQELQLLAATNEEFRAALLSDPKSALAEHGVAIPDGVEVEVIEATPDRLPIVIPPSAEGELSDAALAGLSGGKTSVPIATFEGHCALGP